MVLLGGNDRRAPPCHIPPPSAEPSPLTTVLVMRRSLKGATPSGPCMSEAGLTSRLEPLMVIRGSLGGSTITTALMSGMDRHESSPKHLGERGREGEEREREGRERERRFRQLFDVFPSFPIHIVSNCNSQILNIICIV